MNKIELALRIRDQAITSGYDMCGIIPIKEMAAFAEALEERVKDVPESKALYDGFVPFANPAESFPWAKSVVICTTWYGRYHIPEHLNNTIGRLYLFDGRRDTQAKEYNDAKKFEAELGKMDIRFECSRDFGVTAMRWAAARAGIGVIRKNNFYYNEKGSWSQMDVYLIDQELELKTETTIPKCPEECTLCLEACPTGALAAPYQTNGTACISFLLCLSACGPDKPHYEKCGSWIYGCDSCQNACPFNNDAWTEEELYPGLEELAKHLSYESILTMDYEAMRALLPEKFWYIGADDVWKWKCNVLNAMKNCYEEKYLPYIESATKDERPEVREMAEWVMKLVASK